MLLGVVVFLSPRNVCAIESGSAVRYVHSLSANMLLL
jgi:hypothetical protein